MEAKKIAVVRRNLRDIRLVEDSESRKLHTVEVARDNVRQLIQNFLDHLLEYPSSVYTVVGPRTTVYEIDLKQKDFGRLMGSKGKTIGALRTLVTAAAGSHEFRAIVQIKDEDRFF